jgi:DNA repair protein RadA/Sms
MAARPRLSYRCSSCDATASKWAGRCPQCGEFNTFVEQAPSGPAPGTRTSTQGERPARPAQRITDVDLTAAPNRLTTGLPEFDRVIGGGLVPGQVLLLSGEPGAGKSTILLTLADRIARQTGKRVLYVSGEESIGQIAVRARRIDALSDGLYLADDTDLGTILGHIEEHAAELALVIVDSVQTVASAGVEGRAGGVSQVMEVAQVLTRVAKSRSIPLFLVGQVTKESTVAGPRALEHTVDTTLALDGDKHTSLRLLRAVKNRYGPADEIACFEQTDTGLKEIADPSALFRSTRDQPVPGTCVTITIEGRRPLLAEVQALVSTSTIPNPRRGVSGLDAARVAMLVAVTERHASVRLQDKDLFTATIGGMRLRDPSSDLAVCLAVASAAQDFTIPEGVAAVGEVTLSGDIRSVPMMAQRIAEASRLGYAHLLAPPGTAKAHPTARLDILEVASLGDAYRALAASSMRSPSRPTPVRA